MTSTAKRRAAEARHFVAARDDLRLPFFIHSNAANIQKTNARLVDRVAKGTVWLDDLIMRRHRTINDLARCVSDINFPQKFLLHSSNVGAPQPFPPTFIGHSFLMAGYSSETFAARLIRLGDYLSNETTHRLILARYTNG